MGSCGVSFDGQMELRYGHAMIGLVLAKRVTVSSEKMACSDGNSTYSEPMACDIQSLDLMFQETSLAHLGRTWYAAAP